MARPGLVLALILVVLTAGCSGLFGGDENDGTPTATPTLTTTTPQETPTPKLFRADTDTNKILLRVSDFSAPYNFGDETMKSREELSGEEVLRRHERSFLLDMENGSSSDPLLIILRVTIYESRDAARVGIQNEINKTNQTDATITPIQLEQGVNGTKITFATDSGHNTVIIRRENNMMLFVMAAGSQYYPETTERTIVKMLINANRLQN